MPKKKPQKGKAKGRRSSPSIAGEIVRSLFTMNVLELLAQRPRHGLEMVGEVERGSEGAWSPSAGTLYPMLQRMEDDGLITSRLVRSRGAPRRVYRLTAKGRRERTAMRARLYKELCAARLLIEQHLEAFGEPGSLSPHTPEEMVRALEEP